MEVVASSTTGWEIAEVACGLPRGGFVRDFFAFEGVEAMVSALCLRGRRKTHRRTHQTLWEQGHMQKICYASTALSHVTPIVLSEVVGS